MHLSEHFGWFKNLPCSSAHHSVNHDDHFCKHKEQEFQVHLDVAPVHLDHTVHYYGSDLSRSQPTLERLQNECAYESPWLRSQRVEG